MRQVGCMAYISKEPIVQLGHRTAGYLRRGYEVQITRRSWLGCPTLVAQVSRGHRRDHRRSRRRHHRHATSTCSLTSTRAYVANSAGLHRCCPHACCMHVACMLHVCCMCDAYMSDAEYIHVTVLDYQRIFDPSQLLRTPRPFHLIQTRHMSVLYKLYLSISSTKAHSELVFHLPLSFSLSSSATRIWYHSRSLWMDMWACVQACARMCMDMCMGMCTDAGMKICMGMCVDVLYRLSSTCA